MQYQPWSWRVLHRASSQVPGVSGSNQGHGINIDGRQIYDNNNDDEEVNDTNIDPVSHSATGRSEETVNQR